MLEDLWPVLFVALIPLFIAWWCFVCWMLAGFSGWRRLAAAGYVHPDVLSGQQVEGKRLSCQSAMIGGVSFSNCLTFVVNARGMYLWMLPLFPFFTPLYIPWTRMREVRVRKSVFGLETVSFEVGAPRVAKMQISRRVLKAVRDAYPHLKYEGGWLAGDLAPDKQEQ